jgi:hypothetical protein
VNKVQWLRNQLHKALGLVSEPSAPVATPVEVVVTPKTSEGIVATVNKAPVTPEKVAAEARRVEEKVATPVVETPKEATTPTSILKKDDKAVAAPKEDKTVTFGETPIASTPKPVASTPEVPVTPSIPTETDPVGNHQKLNLAGARFATDIHQQNAVIKSLDETLALVEKNLQADEASLKNAEASKQEMHAKGSQGDLVDQAAFRRKDTLKNFLDIWNRGSQVLGSVAKIEEHAQALRFESQKIQEKLVNLQKTESERAQCLKIVNDIRADIIGNQENLETVDQRIATFDRQQTEIQAKQKRLNEYQVRIDDLLAQVAAKKAKVEKTVEPKKATVVEAPTKKAAPTEPQKAGDAFLKHLDAFSKEMKKAVEPKKVEEPKKTAPTKEQLSGDAFLAHLASLKPSK